MKKLKDITPEDKKEIVLNDPKFGMFSLFKYHLKRGYLNEQLKKTEQSILFSYFFIIFCFTYSYFYGTMDFVFSLVSHEIHVFDGEYCSNTDTIENKLMICGISLIYFARSFFYRIV